MPYHNTSVLSIVSNELTITPALSASYERDLIAQNSKVKARLSWMNQDFDNMPKIKSVKNHYNLGASVAAEQKNVLVAAAYNCKFDKKSTSHQASLKLKVKF